LAGTRLIGGIIPSIKVAAVRALQGEVLLVGESFDEAYEAGRVVETSRPVPQPTSSTRAPACNSMRSTSALPDRNCVPLSRS